MAKGEQTRQRIVAEAATIFNQQGFEGASMATLMEATGLEKGGIYRHFPSKEALAAEAFDYARQQAQDARMEGLDTIANSVDKLKQFVANFVERRPIVPGGCPIFNTAIDSDDGNAVLRARAQGAIQQWIERLSAIVGHGIEQREIRRRIDAGKLATLVISSLEGALVISRLERNNDALLAVQDHLVEYMEKQVRRG